MRRVLTLATALAALALAAQPTGAAVPTMRFRLVPFVSGLDHPLYLTEPAGDPRLFIVEKTGRIRIVRDGRVLPRPFVDLHGLVSTYGEEGLLSVAFDPHFTRNGLFYVQFTDHARDGRVWRLHAAPGADVADTGHVELIHDHHPIFRNHNGGQLLFGPDGDLYVGLGDGGSGGDPHGHGQSLQTLLGKLLRLDVHNHPAGRPYGIPAGQPIRRGALPQIFAYGLRNPWRFDFDPLTHDLWIGDVGQNRFEEIDHVRAGTALGRNFGWNTYEGFQRFKSGRPANGRVTFPVVAYSHALGCSVIGGDVYRGRAIPALDGRYVYADICSGRLWTLPAGGGHPEDDSAIVKAAGVAGGSISSFGVDDSGELYLCSLAGTVYKLEPPT